MKTPVFSYIRNTPTRVAAHLSFGTRAGGHYRIQCIPFGAPPNTWVNASPVLNARTDSMTATSDPQPVPGPSFNLPWRVVSVPPDPFSL